MKLTIERAALLRGLGHSQSVVERRTTIPVLSNVLLAADGGSVAFTATDMDLEIRTSVAATVDEEGAVTVPAHTLYDIARKLPENAKIAIETDAAKPHATVRAGRSTFQLPTLPADDYPAAAAGDASHTFQIPAADLRVLIDRARFAMSNEETRYYLNGVFLHAAEAGGARVLRAAATDGHRLSRAEVPQPEGADGMPGIILPRKTVGELRKLLENQEGSVEVALSASKIRLAIADMILTSKLIDGQFPDYERVIPAANSKHLLVDAKALAAAVDRVSTISTEKSRAVKLEIASNAVILSSASDGAGSAVEEMEAQYEGETIEIGFNARYLLDIIAQIPDGKVAVALENATSPAVLQDAEDASATYVLMPMRC